ncbi:MAG: glycoside hydrolase family 127 protein, partial [Chloroflexia bacterium]
MDVSTRTTPHATLWSLPPRNVRVTGGFWKHQQATNRGITLRDGYQKLEQAGNFGNLRRAAGQSDEQYQGPVFMDEDVYKWLEAVSDEIGNAPDPELAEMADSTIALLTAAQQDDGYLDSYYQVVAPDQKWSDLDHGHEMYCAGHLIQAAIAHHRATGSNALLRIAVRLADHIDSIFGPGRRDGTCGHPEIEMALVELYRETGEERYLRLARALVDRRGRNKMVGLDSYGPEYHQDRVPVREAQQVEGHAVRQLYLTSGVTDIYMETGERALLDAMNRLWHDATAHKMYVTGGFGSRFEGESFGDPYELPSDRCYCETCAAVGSLIWNWRMLLATGEVRFADELERVLYNGFLSGRALDARHYFYMNPLESREGEERPAWHRVACCPPNIMRLVATVGHYLATTTERGVQVHQYMSARVRAGSESQRRTVGLETDYPWNGRVRVTVEETGDEPWELSLRIPAWVAGAEPQLTVNGTEAGASYSGG